MENINLLAIDVAKNIFQLHAIDKRGHCVLKKRLTRQKLIALISNLPLCTLVMEACGGSFYWARQFQRMGHDVKLISPQYVKPYVKGNKTDRNDAEAIAEAASRPTMRFVSLKSIEQQDIQGIHRIRSCAVQQRTQLSNQIRGLLAEYGLIIKKGIAVLRRSLPLILEDAQNELSLLMRRHFQQLYEELCHLDLRIKAYDQELVQIYKTSEFAQKIGKIEGVGPITATAILALGDLKNFRNGRHFAAFLGLVPRESSSGNKQRLLGISKRGNAYLRTLLIHGARTVFIQLAQKQDPKSQWLRKLKDRCGMNRATCALANKTARIIWAVMTGAEQYDPKKTCGFCG